MLVPVVLGLRLQFGESLTPLCPLLSPEKANLALHDSRYWHSLAQTWPDERDSLLTLFSGRGVYPLVDSTCASSGYIGIKIREKNLSQPIVHIITLLDRGGGAPG